jgi:hypothetical protein
MTQFFKVAEERTKSLLNIGGRVKLNYFLLAPLQCCCFYLGGCIFPWKTQFLTVMVTWLEEVS